MISVYIVICDNGDGSQSLEWHRTWDDDKRALLQENDPYDRYASGDGLQMTELKLPNIIDLDNWAFFNNIHWYEEQEPE